MERLAGGGCLPFQRGLLTAGCRYLDKPPRRADAERPARANLTARPATSCRRPTAGELKASATRRQRSNSCSASSCRCAGNSSGPIDSDCSARASTNSPTNSTRRSPAWDDQTPPSTSHNPIVLRDGSLRKRGEPESLSCPPDPFAARRPPDRASMVAHRGVRWCLRATSRSSQSLASAARNCWASWTGADCRR